MLPGQMFRPPVQFVNMPMLHPSILAQQQQGGMNVHLLTLLQQQQQKHQPPANVLLSNGTSFPNQAVAFNQQQLSAGSPINSKGELEGTAPGTHLDGMIESGHTVGVDTNQGFSIRGTHPPPPLSTSFNATSVNTNQHSTLVSPTGNGGGMVVGVGQLDHGGVVIPASVLEEHVRRQQSRKETLCKYFIQGHCPYVHMVTTVGLCIQWRPSQGIVSLSWAPVVSLPQLCTQWDSILDYGSLVSCPPMSTLNWLLLQVPSLHPNPLPKCNLQSAQLSGKWPWDHDLFSFLFLVAVCQCLDSSLSIVLCLLTKVHDSFHLHSSQCCRIFKTLCSDLSFYQKSLFVIPVIQLSQACLISQ